MTDTQQKMGRGTMTQYLHYIDETTTNGDIFGLSRQIQDSATMQGVSFSNIDEFYWFLREHRDSLKGK